MKVNNLANLILKDTLDIYSETNSLSMDGDDIYNKYSDLDEELITNAFRMLKSDNLISIFYSDNKVYTYELNINVLKEEVNVSKLSKLYYVLKELRDWIPGY